jgi:hypothetical protein
LIATCGGVWSGSADARRARVEVLGQPLRGGGVASLLELLDQSPQSLPAVLFVDGLVKRLPVGLTDAFALRQLREQVAHTVNGAMLAV